MPPRNRLSIRPSRSLEISQELERGREVAHSDVVKSQLQENTQQQALQEAKLAMESARLDLAVLLFRDFDENFRSWTIWTVAPALPPLPDVETMAARENPTLAARWQLLRAARVWMSRLRGRPICRRSRSTRCTASKPMRSRCTAPWPHSRSSGPLPNLGYFVTASLNIPVWDWGVRRSKVRQSEIEAEAGRSGFERGAADAGPESARLL